MSHPPSTLRTRRWPHSSPAQGRRPSSTPVGTSSFSVPVVSASRVSRILDVTRPTAHSAIEALVERGDLEEVTGKERNRIYEAHGSLMLSTVLWTYLTKTRFLRLSYPWTSKTERGEISLSYFRRPLLISIIGAMNSVFVPLPLPNASMLTIFTPRPFPLLSAAV
jgi:hypothetical protein